MATAGAKGVRIRRVTLGGQLEAALAGTQQVEDPFGASIAPPWEEEPQPVAEVPQQSEAPLAESTPPAAVQKPVQVAGLSGRDRAELREMLERFARDLREEVRREIAAEIAKLPKPIPPDLIAFSNAAQLGAMRGWQQKEQAKASQPKPSMETRLRRAAGIAAGILGAGVILGFTLAVVTGASG